MKAALLRAGTRMRDGKTAHHVVDLEVLCLGLPAIALRFQVDRTFRCLKYGSGFALEGELLSPSSTSPYWQRANGSV
jgi:hypothetical protein